MSEQEIKVLIVEDEEGIADFMSRILQLKGYTAFIETDGLGAVSFFKEEGADIILIDIDLGYSEIDGVEVLSRIRAMDQDVVCVMMTRITDEVSVRRSKELGALHYLLKPLDSKHVVAAVSEAAMAVKQRRAARG